MCAVRRSLQWLMPRTRGRGRRGQPSGPAPGPEGSPRHTAAAAGAPAPQAAASSAHASRGLPCAQAEPEQEPGVEATPPLTAGLTGSAVSPAQAVTSGALPAAAPVSHLYPTSGPFYTVWALPGAGPPSPAGVHTGPQAYDYILSRIPGGRYRPGVDRLRRYATYEEARAAYLLEAVRHGLSDRYCSLYRHPQPWI